MSCQPRNVTSATVSERMIESLAVKQTIMRAKGSKKVRYLREADGICVVHSRAKGGDTAHYPTEANRVYVTLSRAKGGDTVHYPREAYRVYVTEQG